MERGEVASLRAQLADAQSHLDEQTEALEAARRLSDQLDRKEEAMAALREEGTNSLAALTICH